MAETIPYIGQMIASKLGGPLETYNATSLRAVLSSVDNTVPRFDGTTGKMQTSGVTIDDSNNIIVPADIYSVDWTDYTTTATYLYIDDWTGGYRFYAYKVIGDLVYLNIYFRGHMNAGAAGLGVSVPYNIATDFLAYWPCMVLDGGTWQAGIARCLPTVTATSFSFGVGIGSTIDNFGAGAGAEKGVYLSTWYRK